MSRLKLRAGFWLGALALGLTWPMSLLGQSAPIDKPASAPGQQNESARRYLEIIAGQQLENPYIYEAPRDPHGMHEGVYRAYNQFVTAGDDLSGLTLAPVDKTLASHLGLANSEGLVVTAVKEKSPAAESGLKVHDVILSVDDNKIHSLQEFRKHRALIQERAAKENAGKEKEAKSSMKIAVRRGGKPTTLTLTWGPDVVLRRWREVAAANAPSEYYLGVSIDQADEAIRAQLDLGDRGVVATSVITGSPAEKAGILADDVIYQFNDLAIKSPEDLTKAVAENKDKKVILWLKHRGLEKAIEVAPAKRPGEKVAAEDDLKARTRLFDLRANLGDQADQHAQAIREYEQAIAARQNDLLKAANADRAVAARKNAVIQALNATRAADDEKQAMQNALNFTKAHQASQSNLEKRLDTLDKQIQSLEKTIRDLSESLKAKPGK